MKIHQVINDICLSNGGAQKIARLLHAGIRAKGLQSRLISLSPPSVEAPECSYFMNLRSPYDVNAVLKLVRYMKKHCASDDVIHAHMFPTNLYVSFAARFTNWRGKLVCTEHSTSNRRRGTIHGRIIDSTFYSRYDRIVCISEGTRSELSSWKPDIASKMTVIENGAPLFFRCFTERPAAKKPIVVSVGRLYKLKNYEAALRAVALMKDLDFEYWIAGVGPEEAKLKQLSKELKISHKVRFLGFVEDIPTFLRRGDVFLMPSLWEGFGLSAVEAMNAGLPVVASDVEGLRGIVEASDPCGILVQPGDPASISQGLKTLLLDYEKRLECGKNAFHRANGFSVDAMVARYVELYKKL